MKITRTATAYVLEVGRVVRRFREQASLSQEELAERADLHRTYIGAVERGERNLTVVSLDRISSALRLKPSTILTAVEEQLKRAGKSSR